MTDDPNSEQHPEEFDAVDVADRPLPPRVSMTSRVAILAALLAVVAMVAAGLVIGGRDGDDAVTTDETPAPTDPTTTVLDITVVTDAVAESSTTVEPTSTVVPSSTTTSTTTMPPTTTVASAPSVLAIPNECLAGINICTQLANTSDGRIVALDPAGTELTVYDRAGLEPLEVMPIPSAIVDERSWLLTVGPDDVAYLGLPGGDAELLLYGVPLAGPDRGIAVLVSDGLDGSGDTDLVPAPDGLATVGCCGSDPVRPASDARIVPWLGGASVDVPTFQIRLGDGGNELQRTDPFGGSRSWPLPTAATSLRGMPYVVGTDDGGALMWVFFQPTGTSHLIRFASDWPDGRVDNTQVFHLGDGFEFPDLRLLEAAGTVVVAEGDALVRRTLDEVGSPGWIPEFDRPAADWTVEAVGLNDHIAETQPSWAANPEGLAFELAPEIGPAERFDAQFDPATGELTVEVSNFLDDSVLASRTVWPLRMGDDGRYRVGIGSVSQQCQPGRGQQDFQPDLCT